ncbi:unnamed protein product [Didymodactylos carnosus]|uniref:Uncharacterized protein n=1 Tax=Didymodactylos carnosus TaxID=1234261 RepID=A0A814NMR5_9BILA|nr:unnamed protein product [Didymodactylos carnosus]CAF1094071.1 unnamed protein product [Didymodactylos carnosus]CAF3733979.1 unnamed protein product [Didymodactylos carnosus]CAF3859427.1 unnamed protein product [Didymodactylos carnosus]
MSLKSILEGKVFGLIWLLIECNLLSGNIFGFASLFGVLPRYGIFENYCTLPTDSNIRLDQSVNQTHVITKDCQGQIGKYMVLIDKNIINLSTLAIIWASFGLLMVGSGVLFLDWRFKVWNLESTKKAREISQESEVVTLSTTDKAPTVTNTVKERLRDQLTNPLYIFVTLFLGILLLTASFLPVVWFPWIYYITNKNLNLTKQYTFGFAMATLTALIISPLCGLILDYKVHRGHRQKILNVSIMQTISWLLNILLCVVCMFNIFEAAIAALVINCFSRVFLVGGSQACITRVFSPKYIGTLLGIMWTTAGIISFVISGLAKLAVNIQHAWRAWCVVLFLCILMGSHIIQLWRIYFKTRAEKPKPDPHRLAVDADAQKWEAEALNSTKRIET